MHGVISLPDATSYDKQYYAMKYINHQFDQRFFVSKKITGFVISQNLYHISSCYSTLLKASSFLTPSFDSVAKNTLSRSPWSFCLPATTPLKHQISNNLRPVSGGSRGGSWDHSNPPPSPRF